MSASELEAVRARVVAALQKLEPLFKHHKLTLVARNTNEALEDADIIVTSDDLGAVMAALEEQAYRDAPYVCPGCHTVGGGPCVPGCFDDEDEKQRRWEEGDAAERAFWADDDSADDGDNDC